MTLLRAEAAFAGSRVRAIGKAMTREGTHAELVRRSVGGAGGALASPMNAR